MLIDIQSLLKPSVISRILADPQQILFYVDADLFFLVIKVVVLAILAGYLLFAFTAFIHMRRLEKWLPKLKTDGYFSRWALAHFLVAVAGWLVALVWL